MESQQAFDQGEFGEAVRLLTEAQGLDPADVRVRDLKVLAVRERDRLRQVREAISAGQRAMRLGHPEVAEHEYQRALQLDPANAQAANLLAQIRKDRQGGEREQRLKEGLGQVEDLLSGARFGEAHRLLTELQEAYPEAEVVQKKLQALYEPDVEVAAPTPPAAPPAPARNSPAPVAQAPAPAMPVTETPKAKPMADSPDATTMPDSSHKVQPLEEP